VFYHLWKSRRERRRSIKVCLQRGGEADTLPEGFVSCNHKCVDLKLHWKVLEGPSCGCHLAHVGQGASSDVNSPLEG
jgi:hypothetical protein